MKRRIFSMLLALALVLVMLTMGSQVAFATSSAQPSDDAISVSTSKDSTTICSPIVQAARGQHSIWQGGDLDAAEKPDGDSFPRCVGAFISDPLLIAGRITIPGIEKCAGT